jgi:hypothetical protein
VLFSSVQAYEYAHAPFAFKNSIYGATFFMATGFHGFHVLVGTIFLIVCLIRAMRGDFTPKQHFGFEAAAWYWHFVDVVWLFLFFSSTSGAAGARRSPEIGDDIEPEARMDGDRFVERRIEERHDVFEIGAFAARPKADARQIALGRHGVV